VWLLLWSLPAFAAGLLAWLAALVAGRVPAFLHRFLAAYVRYSTHVLAFVLVIGRRFPGFTGRADAYGIDIAIEPPARQRRLKTLFRGILALPALVLAGALWGPVTLVGFLGWWAALVTGHMPAGLRDLGASCLRYLAQTSAYLLVLTDRYPYASPALRPPPGEQAAAAALPGDAF
jgi:hypothetical protein